MPESGSGGQRRSSFKPSTQAVLSLRLVQPSHSDPRACPGNSGTYRSATLSLRCAPRPFRNLCAGIGVPQTFSLSFDIRHPSALPTMVALLDSVNTSLSGHNSTGNRLPSDILTNLSSSWHLRYSMIFRFSASIFRPQYHHLPSCRKVALLPYPLRKILPRRLRLLFPCLYILVWNSDVQASHVCTICLVSVHCQGNCMYVGRKCLYAY